MKPIITTFLSLVVGVGAMWADDAPLTVYMEENESGGSLECQQDVFYRSELQGSASYLDEYEMGDFDNHVRSFRLKKGYGCTLANNPDGSGYSRTFIAATDDVVFDTMPEGLEWVSFIRVYKYFPATKKGVCNGSLAALTKSTWYYDWSAGGKSTDDYEFVPMRHNLWWEKWNVINSLTNFSTVLAYNEPDHSDQSNVAVQTVIEEWPDWMACGLRIGSPAPDSINNSWVKKFLAEADSLNYRVDFVAAHMYWNSQDPVSLASTIDNLCKNSYDGRTMWITELNNGANWTSESWPDAKGDKRDANFNLLYDENGNTQSTTRPHTEKNSAQQVAWVEKMLPAFDNSEYLERYAFYNWVEDARALVLENKDGENELTPAGKVYADYVSKEAYPNTHQYVHTWKIAPPLMKNINANKNRIRIDWYDHNGETGAGYVIERRVDKGEWKELTTVYAGTDYKIGYNTSIKSFYLDKDVVNGYVEYRLRGLSHSGEKSIASRVIGKQVDVAALDAPTVDSGFSLYSRGGVLVIESNESGFAQIYTPEGRLVRKVNYAVGETEIDGLSNGIYIVNGQKVVVR
jgi:hypothetical protein